jgi:type II secretory ATPase GspE/PulE/Tfp pilus assembly ATPase PilB-like protein
MTSTLRPALIAALLYAGAPTEEAAAELADLKEPGVSWINAVLNTGKVDETRLLTRLGETFHTPFEANFDPNRIERATLSLFSSRFVFQHHIVPLENTESGLTLATYDLFNTAGRQIAAQLTGGKPLRWVLATRAQILRTIKTLYGVGAETFDELLKARGTNADDLFTDRESVSDINANDPEASVVKFVNQIIREAIAERATDIHVEPLENDLRIRYRIDGILHEAAVPQQLRVLQNAIISRLKVMARMDIAEKRLPQDGRINLVAGHTSIDVRVSTIPTVNGESISLRLLSSRDRESFGFERLDLDEAQTKSVRTLLAMPNGIVLVTGPTGSGKSTTLYSFLSSINSVQRRIITIEEPVEYRLPGVSQIDVKPEIGLTFANGLRHILRQDPNVIMVGEIRDMETADISIRAALTGHLVFSTLHTNDAVGGITRLLDMGIEPFLLASTVRAFLAQRLVRTICPHCAKPAEYPLGQLRDMKFPAELGTRFMRGDGCDHCRQTGYQGRMAIHEICVITERLRKLVVAKASGGALKSAAVHSGMKTLRHDGWRRVVEGRTTIEEVLRVTQEDESLSETEKE